MVNNRTFSISGSIFYSYKTSINLDIVDSIEDIITVIINRIKNDMKNYPGILKELTKEESKFHIHDYKFGDILLSEPDAVFYICSHCEKK